MKYSRLIVAVAVGVAVFAACQNPQLSPGPGSDDPDPGDPGPEPLVPVETTVRIDFQNETPNIVAEGFAATGTAVSPAPGQLDADSWSILGLSDGDIDFGQEVATGDVARGVSAGGETVGGIYAFVVGEGDVALGVQPTSGDFAPGSLVLALASPSDGVLALTISYRLWTFNDQGRSTLWSVDLSTDGAEWTPLPELSHSTPDAEDTEPGWIAADYSTEVSLEETATSAGMPVFIRWLAEDGGGDGSRDESALDDIVVTFSHWE